MTKSVFARKFLSGNTCNLVLIKLRPKCKRPWNFPVTSLQILNLVGLFLGNKSKTQMPGPLNNRPRWRSVKHISRWKGQEISAYTTLVPALAAVSPRSPTDARLTDSIAEIQYKMVQEKEGDGRRNVMTRFAAASRPITRPPILQPVEVKPAPPMVAKLDGELCNPRRYEERKSSSPRAPNQPRQEQAPVQQKKRDPLIVFGAPRAVTSDKPKKPTHAPSAVQQQPVGSLHAPLSSSEVTQPLRSQPKQPLIMLAPVSPRGMAPKSLSQTQIRQPFSATSSFPREIGAEIWNVLGVRAVPDGSPQMQFMGSSEVTRPPRSDFNSLHSAVLSFNKYQMEAFRLR